MSRLIVAIGGTTRPDSSTERVLGLAASVGAGRLLSAVFPTGDDRRQNGKRGKQH